MRVLSVSTNVRVRDTSHSPISLCGPSEQSPFGDSLRHVSMAICISSLDLGENAKVVAQAVRDIDPGEPANILVMSPLNDVALWNILAIIDTLDTSNLKWSPLKVVARQNISDICAHLTRPT